MSMPKTDAVDQQCRERDVDDQGKRRRRVRRRRTGKPVPSVTAVLERLLAEKVTRSDGSWSGFTSLQAIVLQLLSKSAAGDKRATKVLMRYRHRDPDLEQLTITVTGGLPDRYVFARQHQAED